MQFRTSQRQYSLILSLVLIIALCVRLIGISKWCFAHDEIFTMEFANLTWIDLIFNFTNNNEPFSPLYYSLIKLLGILFGPTQLAVRLPSVIIGTISIYVLYKLALKFTDKFNSLLICILSAISPTLIFYSQEARHYIFLYFFSLLVPYLAIYYKKKLIPLVLATTFLMHIHYFGFFMSFFIMLFVGIMQKDRILFYSKALAISLITYLPWLPKTISHFFYSPNNTWLPEISLPASLESIFGFFYMGRYQNISSIYTVIITILSLYILYLAVVKRDKKGILLYIWFFVPLFLLLIKSEFTHNSFHKRYLIVSYPAALIIFFYGTNFITKELFKRSISVILFLCMIIQSYSYPDPILKEKTCERPPSFTPETPK